ncbi:hypothetical protein J3E69DRAFT_172338 [Trichoderma sp. SZMC 28015]
MTQPIAPVPSWALLGIAAFIASKTIAKLPSTTLKYREGAKHPYSPPLSPSSSQETLLPSKPSAKFFLDDHDDQERLDEALLSPASGWLTLLLGAAATVCAEHLQR